MKTVSVFIKEESDGLSINIEHTGCEPFEIVGFLFQAMMQARDASVGQTVSFTIDGEDLVGILKKGNNA